MSTDWIGRQLGNFKITGFIGAGAMGAVFRGEHLMLGHNVAIKVMNTSLLDSSIADEALKRFVAEAKALTEIKDQNHIIRLYDFGQVEGGDLYYVMEMLEGHDLERELRKRGRLSPDEAWLYLEQIAAGLAAAHEGGIVHRDLKPGNVFLIEGFTPARLKLLDFGLARRSGAEKMTSSGMGTPIYAAPEQVNAESDLIGPWTDIFSLGVMAYEMLAGVMPYEIPPNASPFVLFMLPVDKDPIPLADRVPGLSPMLCEVVDTCLARDPRARFASARAFADAFATALGRSTKLNLNPGPADVGSAPTLHSASIAAPSSKTSTAPRASEESLQPTAPQRPAATTLGASAGERVTEALPAVPRRRLAPVLAAFVVVALLGGVAAFVLLRDKVAVPQTPPVPAVKTAIKPTPPKKPARKIAISSRDVTLTCALTVGTGKPRERLMPCNYSVPHGSRVKLSVRRTGFAPFEQTLTVDEDTALVVESLARKRKVVRAGTESDAPKPKVQPKVALRKPRPKPRVVVIKPKPKPKPKPPKPKADWIMDMPKPK